MKKKQKHRGFEAVAKSISSKQGIPMEGARAIVAAGARKSSAAARRANPRLNKVSGMPPMKKAPKRKAK